MKQSLAVTVKDSKTAMTTTNVRSSPPPLEKAQKEDGKVRVMQVK